MLKPIATCLAILTLAVPASARTTLIELFASHNCRASDRAHQTLARLDAARDDVLILTWSVDYWDYLGEADPMATPQAMARQARYVDKFGLRGAYTPQTVYNGAVQCPGNRPRDVERAISKAQSRAGSGAEISFEGRLAQVTGPVDADLLLVEFLTSEDATGHMIHPVTNITTLGVHEGDTSSWPLPDCTSGCALILQESGSQDVLAVSRIE